MERWVDSVIAAEEAARFPFTDLASASRLSSSNVDNLLGQVAGDGELHVPGRIVLALLRRRLSDGTLTVEAAVNCAKETAFAAVLTEPEAYHADGLEDSWLLAASGQYGTLEDVRRELTEFLDRYSQFDREIPMVD